MIKAAIVVSAILFVSTSSVVGANNANIDNKVKVNANGDSTSVNIDIKNNVNTDSNSTTHKESSTNIHISQDGEGTSSVKVNGKEWKLEGPGEINVNEKDTEGDGLSPTTVDEPSPTPEQSDLEDSQVLGMQTEKSGLLAKLNAAFANFFKKLYSLFGSE